VGDRRWEGNARCNLGLLHHDQGRSDEARSQFEVALQMSRAMGHTRLECTVLCNLGIVFEAQDGLDEARGYYEKAVAAAHGLADLRSEGQFRGYLGSLYARLGRFEDADNCLARGETLLKDVADALSLGLLLCSRAGTQDLAGDTASAMVTFRRAEELALESKAGPESELGRALQKLRASLSARSDL
jgi:tetratricopeptide (TPR) repeat protein